MPPKIYELKAFRDGRQLGGDANPFLTALDLSPEAAEKTAALLERHLRGAARRGQVRPSDEHECYLEARDIDRDGKGAGQVLFRWVLPVAEDEL